MTFPRRRFLAATSVILGGVGTGFPGLAAPAARKTYRAAVIGRTGGGDYGHGFDVIFRGIDGLSLEAIADPDPAGLKKAQERTGAKRAYPDYREMLVKEKPDLVSIATRQPDCHRDMALAALEAGASLFMEKPMTETVADADAILAVAEKQGAKIVVAHVRRYTSSFIQIKALLKEGFVGEVREVRIQGKQDTRAGGEDLIVLGTHDFDLMRYYFGDPLWCWANVRQAGKDVTASEVRQGNEPILVAGDTIHASFAFPHNLQITWSSIRCPDDWNTRKLDRDRWAFEIYGTRRIIAYQSGLEFAYLDSPFLAQNSDGPRWQALPAPRNAQVPDHQKHPIRDLIHALETDTQPLGSGYDGRWAIEMVAAIYQSHKIRSRVAFPLKDRRNPLNPF